MKKHRPKTAGVHNKPIKTLENNGVLHSGHNYPRRGKMSIIHRHHQSLMEAMGSCFEDCKKLEGDIRELLTDYRKIG